MKAAASSSDPWGKVKDREENTKQTLEYGLPSKGRLCVRLGSWFGSAGRRGKSGGQRGKLEWKRRVIQPMPSQGTGGSVQCLRSGLEKSALRILYRSTRGREEKGRSAYAAVLVCTAEARRWPGPVSVSPCKHPYVDCKPMWAPVRNRYPRQKFCQKTLFVEC